MAIDRKLIVTDRQGNEQEYDILAKDVKFQPDGKDLPTKLAEMEQEIEDAASSGYAPPPGGIPKTDLSSDVQTSLGLADTALQSADIANLATKTELSTGLAGKVDKVTGKGLSTNDFTNEDKAAVATIANKANSTEVYTKSQTYSKSEVDALIAAASSGAVSVTTNQDGTFTIHVGDDDYTINLNHTHENMAKVVKCTEATLPQTLENDTIYVQVDNATTPTEIESLWLFGLEFTAGTPDTTPKLTSPANNLTIDVGTNGGNGVNKTINIKGKNLTQALTIAVSGTGFSVDKNSISANDANNGTTLTITYNGTTASASGTLTITGSTDGISVECALTAAYEAQWQTVDLSNAEVVYGWLNSNGNFEGTGSGPQHSVLVPITTESKIEITTNSSYNAIYIFCKTKPYNTGYTNYTQFLCTGETGRRTQTKGTTEEITLPADCTYVCIGISPNSDNNYQPSLVRVK